MNKLGLRDLPFVIAIALASAFGIGCTRSAAPDAAFDPTNTGDIDLALTFGPGTVINTVAYSITGGGLPPMNGSINVSDANAAISLFVSGIPAGGPYTLTISADSTPPGTHCEGVASGWNVMVGGTTMVNVALVCSGADNTGSVMVNGVVNNCPVIRSVTASPATTGVGGTISLAATAEDSEGSALTYAWTATGGGSFAAPSAANTGYTCTPAGNKSLVLTVSDGSCTKSKEVVVTCVAVGGSTPNVVINEVESNGGTPGDWVELFNAGTAPVDLSGWRFKDNDDSHANYLIPTGTTLAPGAYYVLEEAAFGFGLGGADAARVWDSAGVPVATYSWTAHAAVTYGRCPNGTGAFGDNATSTKGAANACGGGGGTGGSGSGGAAGMDGGMGTGGAAGMDGGADGGSTPNVVINEVESNGGTPGDWVELFNAGSAPADISGWQFKDNDDTHAFYVVPANTIVAAGGYYVLEEAAFGFGLGGADAARVWNASGVPVATYSWTAHAAVTYGRCPNGTGAVGDNATSTKGAANACGGGGMGGAGGAGDTGGTGGSTALAWPGADNVITVDDVNAFPSNLSGLDYQPAAGSAPAVMWAALNSPSKIYRLLWNGTIWAPDTSNGWSAGKLVHYPTGLGAPDTEGLTKAEWDDPAMYVATERDNGVSTVSRLAILRFDTSAAASELTASNEWVVTTELPVVGANLGLEAITYIPDSALVAAGFFDESKNAVYNPANYPNHGTGLFFVGVEGTGMIYGFALDHVANTYVRVATFSSGQPGVMDLAYDREANQLWGHCDDTCGNLSTVFRIATTGANAGRFQVSRVFNRPSTLPNTNNEGITFAPESECVGGQKPFFWSDDSNINMHALRRGFIPCGRFF